MGWFTEPPIATPDHIRFKDMHTLFRDGVIGTKEFRNWLAKVDPSFTDVRDSEVDNQIDQLARERAEAYRQSREEQVPSENP